ncbi:hypothetical protein KUTeg_004010 [Tegillarca granosa]|uniref:Uncharacterized protein n=1 Tax=Tegillarca granosa TaxID=220873 RepID=A0ABQ9FNN5_TEGGR|nr:hypothetical protein KUTeg_004010 [Tegillarca granosa]
MLSFLPVCNLFDFAAEHKQRIFEDLQKLYPNEPRTWDAVARKHLHKNVHDAVSDKDVLKFYSVYEEAIKKIPGDMLAEYVR